MSKGDVYSRIMEDESVTDIIKDINEKVKEYGEEGDSLTCFLMGALSQLYSDPSALIALFEQMKLVILMRTMGETQTFFQEYQRRNVDELKPT